MTRGKRRKVQLFIAISVVALIILAVIAVLIYKSNVYRLIAVEFMEGDVELHREGELEQVFEGMHLKSGDTVDTGKGAKVLLLADEDKHILAEENTGFSITAIGNEEKGGITIYLEYGSALITIDNKLAEESSFEVQTSNATLSVRGTVFRVTYDTNLMRTTVEVLEGTVEIASETNVILGNAGEIYYVDEQGAIQSGMPQQEVPNSGEFGTGDDESGTGSDEVGTDIGELPNNDRLSPLKITQAEFESEYVEEIIELTPENTHAYFEVIRKDGAYSFVLKPGYTGYGDGYTVETSDGDSVSVSAGASRYLFAMENADSAEGWMESWVANGTIVKYHLPDDMWCKVGDIYLILLEMDNGNIYAIVR